ncbi:Arginine and glutamate-rich protein 1 [Sciurus carolinensis]|uniref:Arginine and glutamate-rich protein 1 n=1 Tax=Sciurus carolinensis TaxID=30640 RepID=A0AA41MJN0_SCICA|nr:Arginine and glutamate-rich protein 1 [Sciurus carolinensis]
MQRAAGDSAFHISPATKRVPASSKSDYFIYVCFFTTSGRGTASRANAGPRPAASHSGARKDGPVPELELILLLAHQEEQAQQEVRRSQLRSQGKKRVCKRSKSRESKRNPRESRSRSRSTNRAVSRREQDRERASFPPDCIDIFGRKVSKRSSLDEKQKREEEEKKAEFEQQQKIQQQEIEEKLIEKEIA